MTTVNRIDSEENPVNSTGAEGNEGNTAGHVETIIQKVYLRSEYAVLLTGEVSGELLRQTAAQAYKVFLVADAAETLEEELHKPGGLVNVEVLLPAEVESQIPPESMDAVIAVIDSENGNQPLPFMKTMAALLRPAGRLVLVVKEPRSGSWDLDGSRLKVLMHKADLVNVILQSEPDKLAAHDTSIQECFFLAGSKNVAGARSNVRKRYQSLAEESSCCGETEPSCCCPSSCCCGTEEVDSTVTFNTGYSIEDIQPLPEESARLTLGCGNPIARANLQPGEQVLDIGSGAGIDVLLAARIVGEKGKAVGVDMTPAMLERARLAASKGKFSNVEFKMGHAEALPLEDNTFDAVISNCVINLCEDKGKVFEEIYRVLHSGGRMVISDIVTDGDIPLEARLEAAGWAACISGALPHTEYLGLLKQAGFSIEGVQQGISGGTLGDTRVYSLEITAWKP
ncbi:MAG TPA: arsenite methyltransferase [Anaerolineaceae bacterium]|nr:arsenite methyltransferase [Anaerolineaceae bacterium]HQN04961.1 arsenite methyltransferase [Anaerolineaceae bacterium]HQP07795.1 arsenite methyltransferase [Anaerolineaceae bacterium]